MKMNLNELRSSLAAAACPFKVVMLDSIEYVGRVDDGSSSLHGKNVYKVEGNPIFVSDNVSRELDKQLCIAPKQAKIVKGASGESGIRDFRNYLAAAGSMSNPVKVALTANPATRTVTGIIPVEQDVIPADAFVDLAETFSDANNLYPERFECSYDMRSGISVYFNSNDPDVREVSTGDRILCNSYYLRWNLGKIELGRYFIRLVCMNGQTMTVRNRKAEITSLRPEPVKELLEVPRDVSLLDASFADFKGKVVEAMSTRASLSELKYVSDKLHKYMVEDDVSAKIAPFKDQMMRYCNSGFSVTKAGLAEMKASMTVWDLYNRITDFASNNNVWAPEDNRRGMLQTEAVNFLMRPRDIRSYADVFGD